MYYPQKWVVGLLLVATFVACRRDEPVLPEHDEQKEKGDSTAVVKGFYLLNEGNMGSNKATLDYFDYLQGVYCRNIFAERNPSVTKELGDVGNDVGIYGDKLYAVINCSNLVEVMEAATAKHIGFISIPNGRYLCFYQGKAYVSSYAGPMQIGHRQLGYIAEIDTTTLQITRTVTVGYNPEEMAVVNGRMYVPNSGGYLIPNYDNTLSVIDMDSFTEVEKITLRPNMHHIRADRRGLLYINERGDYYGHSSDLFVFDPNSKTIVHDFELPTANFCLQGDSLYAYGMEFSYESGQEQPNYALIHLPTRQVVNRHFLAPEVESAIKTPYGIAVHPVNHEIILTDATDHVTPGVLYYLHPDGSLKWKQTTGDIPAHIAFVY